VVFFGQGLEINSSSSSFFGLVSSGLGYLVMEDSQFDTYNPHPQLCYFRLLMIDLVLHMYKLLNQKQNDITFLQNLSQTKI